MGKKLEVFVGKLFGKTKSTPVKDEEFPRLVNEDDEEDETAEERAYRIAFTKLFRRNL